MQHIRVLIVDDNELTCDLLHAILEEDPSITVVGVAHNGLEAVRMSAVLKPNLVTMDISMPVMDGLDAISEIMSNFPVPILVVSETDNADAAFSALSKGALEVLPKSEIHPTQADRFLDKIKLLSKIKVISHVRSMGDKRRWNWRQQTEGQNAFKGVVAIAASTGGPKALSVLLPELPANFPWPIMVAQHISPGFVDSLVAWQNRITPLKVKIALNDEPLVPGTVYYAPGGKHLSLSNQHTVQLIDCSSKDIYRPSCDRLFSSVAMSSGSKSTGIILTGMGDDGVIGLAKIKNAGGWTIAQDQESSLVFGMPKIAIDSGCVDQTLSLSAISKKLLYLAQADYTNQQRQLPWN